MRARIDRGSLGLPDHDFRLIMGSPPCRYRILYKMRTKNLIQFEAR